MESATARLQTSWDPEAEVREQEETKVLSLIVQSRNESQSILEATIDGLLRTTSRYRSEIIVIDDGSDPPLERSRQGITWIRNDSPIGVSGARRLGAESSKGGILVWLDAHMTFGDGWIENLLAHVSSGSLLCSAAWDYELTTCTGWGANLEWCTERNYRVQRVPGFKFRRRTRVPTLPAGQVPVVVGACYMMSRRSFDRLGGISPLLRGWGYDDVELSIRSWMAGLGVRCVRDARVGHLYRSSFPYPVHFCDLEFNQAVMLESIFEESTLLGMKMSLEPLPEQTRMEVDSKRDEIARWREVVQSKRAVSDTEFFRVCMPNWSL